MPTDLHGRTLVIAGGDGREMELAERLRNLGARVWMVGFLPDAVPPGCDTSPDLWTVLREQNVDALLCPMSGTNPDGRIRAVMLPGVEIRIGGDVLGPMRRGSVLVIGTARPVVRDACARLGIRLVELSADDEMAWRNAVPTAEGALALAMANARITIHSSRSVVVGYGRCGQQICRLLVCMGASVRAIVFDAVERARAWAAGLEARSPRELPEALRDADMVFNTAPAPVLTARVLAGMRRDSLILDVASEPGGTDFEAAARLGIRAIHALGLPGRTAPRTAGAILADVVPRLLARELDAADAGRGE